MLERGEKSCLESASKQRRVQRCAICKEINNAHGSYNRGHNLFLGIQGCLFEARSGPKTECETTRRQLSVPPTLLIFFSYFFPCFSDRSERGIFSPSIHFYVQCKTQFPEISIYYFHRVWGNIIQAIQKTTKAGPVLVENYCTEKEKN